MQGCRFPTRRVHPQRVVTTRTFRLVLTLGFVQTPLRFSLSRLVPQVLLSSQDLCEVPYSALHNDAAAADVPRRNKPLNPRPE